MVLADEQVSHCFIKSGSARHLALMRRCVVTIRCTAVGVPVDVRVQYQTNRPSFKNVFFYIVKTSRCGQQIKKNKHENRLQWLGRGERMGEGRAVKITYLGNISFNFVTSSSNNIFNEFQLVKYHAMKYTITLKHTIVVCIRLDVISNIFWKAERKTIGRTRYRWCDQVQKVVCKLQKTFSLDSQAILLHKITAGSWIPNNLKVAR